MKHKIYFFLHSFHKQFGVFSDFCVMAQGIRWLWYNNCWCLDFFGELNPVLIIILITFRVFYYFKRSELKNYSTFILVVCAAVIIFWGKNRDEIATTAAFTLISSEMISQKKCNCLSGCKFNTCTFTMNKNFAVILWIWILECGSKLKTLGASIKVVSSRPCQIRVQLFLSKKQTKDCWFLVL